MAVHDDDIGGLFKSFGAPEGNFKELSRQTEARDAGERWPLFKAIPIEKRAAPPALSESQKNQWKVQQPVPQPAAVTAPAAPGLSKQLASGLMRFTSRIKPAAIAPAAPAPIAPAAMQTAPPPAALRPAQRSAPAAAPAPISAPTPAPAPVAAARSPFARASQPVQAMQPGKLSSLFAANAPEPAAPPKAPAKGGLFGRKAPAPAAAAPTPTRSGAQPANASLSSLFQRLEGPAEPAVAPKKRDSIFSRLGRS